MSTSTPFPEQPPERLAVNSRYVNIAPAGQFNYAELISTSTTLTYEPTSGTSRAIFHGKLHYKPADHYLPIGNPNGVQEDILTVELNDKRNLTVVPSQIAIMDPVTGADLRNISVAGMELLIKFAYDKFHNAQALELAQRKWQLENDMRRMEAERLEQERQIVESGRSTQPRTPDQAGYDAFAEAEEGEVASNVEDPEAP